MNGQVINKITAPIGKCSFCALPAVGAFRPAIHKGFKPAPANDLMNRSMVPIFEPGPLVRYCALHKPAKREVEA